MNFLKWVTIDLPRIPRNQWVKAPKPLMLYYTIIFHCFVLVACLTTTCVSEYFWPISIATHINLFLALYKYNILPHKPENTISFVIFETKETNREKQKTHFVASKLLTTCFQKTNDQHAIF